MLEEDCKCPKCGKAIPEEAPTGLCPQCSFELALSGDRSAAPEGNDFSDGSPSNEPEEQQTEPPPDDEPGKTIRENSPLGSDPPSGGGGSLGTGRRNRDRGRFARWVVLLLLLLLASYGLTRMSFAKSYAYALFEQQGENAADFYLQEYYQSKLATDERITHINGAPVDGLNVPEMLREALSEPRMQFTLTSPQGTRDVDIPSINWRVHWTRLLVGLVIAALGTFVFWLKPRGKSSVGFLVFCFFLGILWSARAVPFFERVGVERAFYHLFQAFLPVAGVVFAVTFTPLRGIIEKPKRIIALACIPSAVLLLVNFVWYPEMTARGVFNGSLIRVWALLVLAVVLISLPHNLWARMKNVSLSPTDRQRSLIIRLALLLSFLPPILFLIVGRWIGIIIYQDVLSELVVLLFPLIIGYAVVRHNLLSISDLMLEGTLYSLLIIGLLLGYAAMVSIASSLLPEQQAWVQASFAGITAVVAVPVHSRVRTFMQVRFDRVPFDYEVLIDTLDELTKNNTSINDYCGAVASRLSKAANTEEVSLILRKPGEFGITLLENTPHEHPKNLVYDCQVLIEDLQDGGSEISADSLVDAWSSETQQSSTFNVLKALRANIVFPLFSQGQLIGALALGTRVDSRNYTGGEIKTFRRVARHLATTLIQMINRMAALSGERIADLYPACPERIGRYHIDRALGEGGTAYVYRGRSVDGWAAIKVCNRNVQASRQLMERFHREAKAMQRLNHPNVLPVLEVGWEGPEPFIAMEYFSDGSLEEKLEAQGALSEQEALEYTRQIASGLMAAQQEGIIHRDIKPRNLFVAEGNRIVIGDFGFAKIANETTLTRVGEIFGTPHYISPEVLEGGEADWRADQYALGITLFYMLTGHRPFEAEKLEVLYQKYLTQRIPDVRDLVPGTSEGTAVLVNQMVTKDRDLRFEEYGVILEKIGKLSLGAGSRG